MRIPCPKERTKRNKNKMVLEKILFQLLLYQKDQLLLYCTRIIKQQDHCEDQQQQQGIPDWFVNCCLPIVLLFVFGYRGPWSLFQSLGGGGGGGVDSFGDGQISSHRLLETLALWYFWKTT